MDWVDPMALQGEGYSDNAFVSLKFLDADGNPIPENSGPVADLYFQYCGGLTTALAMGYAAGAEVREMLLAERSTAVAA